MSRGKKPNVAQRNALKKKVKDEWVNYEYIRTEIIDLDSSTKHLTKDGEKEKYFIFRHKETGEEIKARGRL